MNTYIIALNSANDNNHKLGYYLYNHCICDITLYSIPDKR